MKCKVPGKWDSESLSLPYVAIMFYIDGTVRKRLECLRWLDDPHRPLRYVDLVAHNHLSNGELT